MTNLQEKWEPVNGYESCYLVSNLGRIKTIGRYIKRRWETPIFYPEKFLVPRIDRYGYVKVSLYQNGLIKHTTLHRIVAEAFIKNPLNKKEVNHIDGNKLNNRAVNLEWVTNRENIIHAERNGLRNRERDALGRFS